MVVFALVYGYVTRQTVKQNGDKLVNAGQGCAQFMRDNARGEKLVFKFELLLAAHVSDCSSAWRSTAWRIARSSSLWLKSPFTR